MLVPVTLFVAVSLSFCCVCLFTLRCFVLVICFMLGWCDSSGFGIYACVFGLLVCLWFVDYCLAWLFCVCCLRCCWFACFVLLVWCCCFMFVCCLIRDGSFVQTIVLVAFTTLLCVC